MKLLLFTRMATKKITLEWRTVKMTLSSSQIHSHSLSVILMKYREHSARNERMNENRECKNLRMREETYDVTRDMSYPLMIAAMHQRLIH